MLSFEGPESKMQEADVADSDVLQSTIQLYLVFHSLSINRSMNKEWFVEGYETVVIGLNTSCIVNI